MQAQNPPVSAQVTHNRQVAPEVFHIAIDAPALARQARPGQFVMIRPGETTDPLLRRPFSLCGVLDDRIEILYALRGTGTRLMAEWMPGRAVDVIGPFGNGFQIPQTMTAAVLVAGGIGCAPLVYLARCIKHSHRDAPLFFFMGVKSSRELISLDEILGSAGPLWWATEDGSRGFKGTATELLADCLKKETAPAAAGSRLFGCGPQAMGRELAGIAAAFGIPCQISLESRMACGTGACLGCVIRTTETSGAVNTYKRICSDGPVFDSTQIDWEQGVVLP